jgi:hypothetical protein
MTTKAYELLKASDEELFTGGACHVYAAELKKRWPRLTTKHAGNADAIGSTRAMHVYAAFGDYKIDVRGRSMNWSISIRRTTSPGTYQWTSSWPSIRRNRLRRSFGITGGILSIKILFCMRQNEHGAISNNIFSNGKRSFHRSTCSTTINAHHGRESTILLAYSIQSGPACIRHRRSPSNRTSCA